MSAPSAPRAPAIVALQKTAARLRAGAEFRWAHMGSCNCGHLAQTITARSKDEIHRLALERAGDWGEQVVELCPDSGLPIDDVIDAVLELGFSRDDLFHLERLSDPAVLREVKARTGRTGLDKRSREDAVLYFEAWASRLARLSEAASPRVVA